ncbi:MAG: prepilin peptidase [Candidatus Micrarchaeaceae archaeon]
MFGIGIGVGVLGLILGSFVNALVWRLHEQEEPVDGRSHTDAADLSILQGRSMCPRCRHQLAVADLVPVASWLALRGKCRYCHTPISWQYPVVELVTALLFVASYVWWPSGFAVAGGVSFGLWLLFLTGFMALAVYDLKWYLLPDRIVFPLICLAFAQISINGFLMADGWGLAAHAFAAAVCLSGLFFLLHTFSRGMWIGFGDVKLAIVLGLLAGDLPHMILLLFGAALLGTAVAVPLLLRGKANAKTPLPFGPFLLASTYLTILFGEKIIGWYLGLFGLR